MLARLLRRIVGAVLVAALVVLAWRSSPRRSEPPPAVTPHGDVLSSPAQSITERPPAPADERPDRVLAAPPLPDTDGSYRFLAVQPGTGDPVAYDPCQPVHLVVNPRTAPPDGDRLLRESLARVSNATGLQMVVDGTTDQTPSRERPVYQPERYPGRWAPILVAWSDPTESPRLVDNVAGYGGSAWMESSPGQPSVFVTGSVTLDGPQLAEMLERRGGAAAARRVVLHELGHLVGLDHVDDRSQVMSQTGNGNVSMYGGGDLTGLALVGRGRCFPGI